VNLAIPPSLSIKEPGGILAGSFKANTQTHASSARHRLDIVSVAMYAIILARQ